VTVLIDANVLIALAVALHVHHGSAEVWFGRQSTNFATCPITQGSLLRALMRSGHSAEAAKSLLAELEQDPRHVFWPDDVAYQDVRLEGIMGHRQVTSAYLAQLARVNQGRLATFDEGLAALHSDVAELVPVRS
jgi:toxin-antitoxin system PIN domain toxin